MMKHLEMFELIYFEMIKDLLKPLKDEVMDLEGETVTLSCKYSGSVYNVQWYQQKSSSSPQFIIADFSAKTEKYSVKHDKQNQEFHLQISSAAVTDSAVYYCALRPTVTGNNKTLYKNLQTTQFCSASTRGETSLPGFAPQKQTTAGGGASQQNMKLHVGAEELLCSLCSSFSTREKNVAASHLDDDGLLSNW
uniref:Ig-like domain-containing protein n=1 Tax=Oryzias melastigma TaxID=30732 RepID=A0A3B3DYJ5_ORYME